MKNYTIKLNWKYGNKTAIEGIIGWALLLLGISGIGALHEIATVPTASPLYVLYSFLIGILILDIIIIILSVILLIIFIVYFALTTFIEDLYDILPIKIIKNK